MPKKQTSKLDRYAVGAQWQNKHDKEMDEVVDIGLNAVNCSIIAVVLRSQYGVRVVYTIEELERDFTYIPPMIGAYK